MDFPQICDFSVISSETLKLKLLQKENGEKTRKSYFYAENKKIFFFRT